MQPSLYQNPAFATGLSSLLQQFMGGSAQEVAQAELYASQAGLNNDTRRYREAIGEAGAKQDLSGLLVSALQGGMGAAAPQIASSLASLPAYGMTPEQQGQIQVGTGTQSAGGTFSGLADTLANRLSGIGIEVQGRKDIAQAQIDADAAQAREGFAAYRGGLDSYFNRLGQIESGWKGGAQNPKSSAGGYFQWTDGTANQYGVTKGDLDSEMQGIQRFTLDNAHTFESMLGREPQSEGELYLMHQQGAGGAARLLQNPGARAVDVVGRDAVVNNGGTEDMTAGQFAQHVMGYYGGGQDDDRYGLLLAAGAPGVNPQQSRVLSTLAETILNGAAKPGAAARTISPGGRSALLSALEEDGDPSMGLSIVAAAEKLLQDRAMTENDALAYASNPDNWERGPGTPAEESWLPFGIGDTPAEPGPLTGGLKRPGAQAMPDGYTSDMVLQEARDAIAQGRDRAMIEEMLRSYGIDPGVL